MMVKSSNEILSLWRNHKFDNNLKEYKQIIEPHPVIGNMFSLGMHVIFILDLSKVEYVYISTSLMGMIGYSPDSLMNKDGFLFWSDRIHPDDREEHAGQLQKCWEFSLNLPLERRKSFKYNLEYRIRKSTGKYIRLLQQATILEVDKKGNPLHVFGICTNISHMGKLDHPTLAITNEENGKNYIYDLKEKKMVSTKLFTPKEKQILGLMARGLVTKEIADKLNIAFNTVKTHRRNMLLKARKSNSVELVHYALQNGFI